MDKKYEYKSQKRKLEEKCDTDASADDTSDGEDMPLDVHFIADGTEEVFDAEDPDYEPWFDDSESDSGSSVTDAEMTSAGPSYKQTRPLLERTRSSYSRASTGRQQLTKATTQTPPTLPTEPEAKSSAASSTSKSSS